MENGSELDRTGAGDGRRHPRLVRWAADIGLFLIVAGSLAIGVRRIATSTELLSDTLTVMSRLFLDRGHVFAIVPALTKPAAAEQFSLTGPSTITVDGGGFEVPTPAPKPGTKVWVYMRQRIARHVLDRTTPSAVHACTATKLPWVAPSPGAHAATIKIRCPATEQLSMATQLESFLTSRCTTS